jgi:hypothetical protein
LATGDDETPSHFLVVAADECRALELVRRQLAQDANSILVEIRENGRLLVTERV